MYVCVLFVLSDVPSVWNLESQKEKKNRLKGVVRWNK